MRLTLTSGVAVTGSDVSGALAVYLTPCMGQTLPIFDGTDFVAEDIGGELSCAASDATYSPAAMAANKNYGLVVWKDGLAFRLSRTPAWSSDTDPGTGAGSAEAELLGGYWVNKYAIANGPAARRGLIVGGIASNSAAQMEDTCARRFVSNVFNVAPRPFRQGPVSGSWTYATAAWRFAENNSANAVSWFHAFDGMMANVSIQASARSDTAGSVPLVGIGFDGASPSNLNTNGSIQSEAVANMNMPLQSTARVFLGRGRHSAGWYEYVTNGGTATYLSGSISGLYQSGIIGETPN